MNAYTPRLLTEAETSLIAAYDAISGIEPRGPDSSKARSAALAGLKKTGLPTRRVEAFHYTDLRSLLTGKLVPTDRPSANEANEWAADYNRLVSAIRLPVMNGHYFSDLGDDLPEGIMVLPGAPAPQAGIDHDDPAHAVDTISTLFANDGMTIEIDTDVTIETPVGIANQYRGEAAAIAASRNRVEMMKGSTATFIDRSVGPDGLGYLTNQVTDLVVGEGADVTWVIANTEGDMAQRLAKLSVRLEKDARLTLFVLNAGGKLVRQELDFVVAGENAELNISGANLIGGKAHIDVTSAILHEVPRTVATETFRNVATGHGSGVFQGQIRVAQAAQLTDARMACNTLLLSDDCDFSAKPELEIFADDVQCAHGATVSDLEDSYLFYLRARGISETRARQMLVRAFVAEVIEELENEELVEAIERHMDVWMDRHV
ncbi:MAG: Fe-S cluster assembly protein SufD [Rhizobiaceae bacterium]